jgi:hypothetical protein
MCVSHVPGGTGNFGVETGVSWLMAVIFRADGRGILTAPRPVPTTGDEVWVTGVFRNGLIRSAGNPVTIIRHP